VNAGNGAAGDVLDVIQSALEAANVPVEFISFVKVDGHIKKQKKSQLNSWDFLF